MCCLYNPNSIDYRKDKKRKMSLQNSENFIFRRLTAWFLQCHMVTEIYCWIPCTDYAPILCSAFSYIILGSFCQILFPPLWNRCWNRLLIQIINNCKNKQNKAFKSYYESGIIILEFQHNMPPRSRVQL